MIEINWTRVLGHRDRQPFALVIGPNGDIVRFIGESIPSKIVVMDAISIPNGKWGRTEFKLKLGPGVEFIHGHMGWNSGSLCEALGIEPNWIQLANRLKVSVTVIKELMREWRPKESAKIDSIENELAELDEIETEGADTCVFTFGAPNKRERACGFWERPVVILVDDKEVGRVTPSPDWSCPVVNGSIRLLETQHDSGRGGGYVTLRVAAPIGAKAILKNE